MSRFTSQTDVPGDLANIGFDPERIVRAQATDDLIAQTRAVTPASVLDKRSQPRLSIAEMNSLDLDAIQDRLSRSRRDDRPGYIKALDLIDLPRNAIANVVFPAARRHQAQAGERATFGLPRVMFSDALREMGVENRIVRGVVGFAGDVVMDPLTYLGGAGVVKAVGTKGTTIISRGAAKELNRGISVAAHGGAVRTPQVADVIRSAGFTDEAIAGARQAGRTPKQIRADITQALQGEVTGGAILSRLGGDLKRTGGIIPERAFQRLDEGLDDLTRQQIDAVARFVEWGNPTRRPGLRIGNAGTQVAHLPFTDIGISVPAFTPMGRGSVAAMVVSRARELVDPADVSEPLLLSAFGDVKEAATTLEDAQHRYAGTLGRLRDMDDAIDAAEQGQVGAVGVPGASPVEVLRTLRADRDAIELEGLNTLYESQERLGELNDGIRTAIDALVAGGGPTSDSPRAANQLVAMGEMLNQTQAIQAKAQADAAFFTSIGHARTRAGEVTGQAAELAEKGDATNAYRLLTGADDLEDVTVGLIEFVGRDAEAASRFVDSLNDMATASTRVANQLHDSVAVYANAGEDAASRYVAQSVLGLDELSLGHSLLSNMADVLEPTGGGSPTLASNLVRRLDRAKRDIWHIKSGHQQQRLASVSASLGRQRQSQIQSRVAAEWGAKLKEVVAGRIPAHQWDLVSNIAYAKMYQIADPHGHIYPLKTLDGEPNALARTLSKLNELDLSKAPELSADLDRIAREAVERTRELGGDAAANDLLRSLMAGYVPAVASAEARRAIGAMRAEHKFPGKSLARTTGVGGAEGFQHQRTTWRHVFTDPETGRTHELFEFEIAALKAYTKGGKVNLERIARDFPRPPDLPAGTPSAADLLAEKADVLARYEKLVRAGGEVATTMPTDVFTLNEKYRQGFFRLLTGSDPSIENFFETNLPLIMASREAQHHRAMAKRTFLNHIALVSRRMDDPKLQSLSRAVEQGVRELELPSGAKAKLVGGRDNPSVIIGGERFRQLRDVPADSLLADIIGDARNYLVPEKLASRFEDMAEMLTPDRYGALFNGLETMTGVWKSLTLAHPSWFLNNMVSNAVLSAVGGADVTRTSANMAASIRAIRAASHRRGGIADIAVEAGPINNAADLVREAFDRRVIGNNATWETFAQAHVQGHPTIARRTPIDRGFVEGLSDLPREARWAYETYLRAGAGPTVAGGRAGLDILRDRSRRAMIVWFRLNQQVDDSMRLATFMTHLQQGDDVASAASKTITSMADYADFSQVERRVFRNLFPFYSWTRFAMSYFLKLAFTDPKWVAAVPKFNRALEETLAGEGRVPDHQRPEWMRRMLAVQVMENPDQRLAVLTANIHPQAEAFNVLQGIFGREGAMEVARYGTNMLNPVLSVPVQIGTGVEFFSGRTIGPTAEDADLSISEFLRGQIRPIAEVEKVGRTLAQDGPGMAAARSIAGGRVQDFSADRVSMHLAREIQDEERRIRASIRRRQFRGEDTQGSRVKLMQLYRRAMELGRDDLVPAWAEDQLGMMAQTSQ
jgi:hypothetical protein